MNENKQTRPSEPAAPFGKHPEPTSYASNDCASPNMRVYVDNLLAKVAKLEREVGAFHQERPCVVCGSLTHHENECGSDLVERLAGLGRAMALEDKLLAQVLHEFVQLRDLAGRTVALLEDLLKHEHVHNNCTCSCPEEVQEIMQRLKRFVPAPAS